MELSEVELSLVNLETETNSLNADLLKLKAVLKSKVGYTRADIMDIEAISGESLITSELPLVLFGSEPTQTGSELIGESIIGTIFKTIKKAALRVWDFILSVLAFGASLFKSVGGASEVPKKVYDGDYNRATSSVSLDDARLAVIERLQKKNPSLMFEQLFSGVNGVSSFAMLVDGFSLLFTNVNTLFESFSDYQKDVLTVISSVSKGDISFASKDAEDIGALLYVEDDLANNSAVGRFAPTASRLQLGKSILNIRKAIPNILGSFNRYFPELDEVSKLGDKPGSVGKYFHVLDRELKLLGKTKSKKESKFYNYRTMEEVIDIFDRSMDIFVTFEEPNKELIAKTKTLKKNHERLLELLKAVSDKVDKDDIALNNSIDRITTSLSKGMLECQENSRSVIKMYGIAKTHLNLIDSVKSEMMTHPELSLKR